MNKALTKLTMLAVALSMFSCEKTVYFEVETQENLLVVNALIIPDSVNDATISLSVDPIAIGFDAASVSDATVDVYRNDVLSGTFISEGGGYYTLPPTVLAGADGEEVRFEVSAPGRESVSATTTIPTLVPITSLEITDTLYETISYSVIDDEGNVTYIDTIVPYFNLELTFDDPIGEDHYMLDIDYQDAFSYVQACYTTNDPVFTVESSYGYGGANDDGSVTFCGDVVFSDQSFEGKTKTISALVYAIETTFTIDPTFVVTLKHISDDYYKYYTTSQQQYYNNGDPFSEPTVVFDNITGGFGIVAGYTVSKSILPLD
ncbi:MAG TPA: DUF4249 domain-containing protein [Chitinophagales bacterium]|nr:DUF4249 domain-containing protein [Chitinophagales bacterium]